MKIVDFIKHYAYCSQNQEGDYDSSFKLDFILSEPSVFDIYGKQYTIDRIRMISTYCGDECDLFFANDEQVFAGIELSLRFIRMIYKRILIEQKRGQLRGWDLADCVADYYNEMKKELKEPPFTDKRG
jgi:hypothetical protein